MKLTKEGNKVILELEEEDAGSLPMEVAVDAFYMGIKQLIENPVLMNKLSATYQSMASEEIKAYVDALHEKWEL